MLLGSGINRYALSGKDRLEPFGRPIALRRFVDPGQRLQQHRASAVPSQAGTGQRIAEVLPVPTACERRCPDRAAEIEGKDLGAIIALKLQRHQREQHRLAGPGRADDQSVPDVANMERKPEWGRAFGPRIE